MRTYNSAPVTATVGGTAPARTAVENVCVDSAMRTDAEAAQVVDGPAGAPVAPATPAVFPTNGTFGQTY